MTWREARAGLLIAITGWAAVLVGGGVAPETKIPNNRPQKFDLFCPAREISGEPEYGPVDYSSSRTTIDHYSINLAAGVYAHLYPGQKTFIWSQKIYSMKGEEIVLFDGHSLKERPDDYSVNPWVRRLLRFKGGVYTQRIERGKPPKLYVLGGRCEMKPWTPF